MFTGNGSTNDSDVPSSGIRSLNRCELSGGKHDFAEARTGMQRPSCTTSPRLQKKEMHPKTKNRRMMQTSLLSRTGTSQSGSLFADGLVSRWHDVAKSQSYSVRAQAALSNPVCARRLMLQE